MAQNPTYQDGTLQNLPYGLLNTNPLGSPFLSESIYSPEAQWFMERFVMKDLFNATPMKWQAPDVNYLLAKALTKRETTNSQVMEYGEIPFFRFPLVAANSPSAVASVPGSTVTQDITATATSVIYFQPGKRLFYPDGSNGIIDAISGTTVTVRSLANKGLPAVTAGQTLADGDYAGADGMTRFLGLDRLPTIRRYNYLQLIGPRAVKWDRLERTEMENNQMFDYIQQDSLERARQLALTLHGQIWQSQRGESALNSPGEKFKTMQGIDDAMLTAGAPVQDVSVSALKDTFEFLAQATDWQGYGQMRFLVGSPRLLTTLSNQYKWEKTRFTAMDGTVKLDLDKISFSGMDFGFMPMPTWNSTGLFGSAYQNRLYCINWDNVSLVGMKGRPMFEYGLKTLSRTNATPGSEKDYEITYSQAACTLKINNPASFFRLNVLGL